LFKNELQAQIDKDFARQDESISQLAHRNRFIAQKYKESSEDVKRLVEKSRLRVGDVEQQKVVWADADSISEDEIQRRNDALRLNEYVYKLP
jgi:hypothetical protein